MLQARLHLTCDDCGNPYPACGIFPSPVDGVLYTAGMLRKEAKLSGWSRDGHRRDFCRRCSAKPAKKKGGKR
jgi:hypothetical protein